MSIVLENCTVSKIQNKCVFELLDKAPEDFSFLSEARYNDILPLSNSPNVQNTLLRGDNLDALLGLYCMGVRAKAIYIDPPYNTGKSFIYNDKFNGVDGAFGHQSAWMNFMLPRLLLACELLEPTGVIFVSIDDNAQAYLRVLLDRILGFDNFIAQFVVVRSKNGRGSSKNVALSHEYVFAYGKTDDVAFRGRMEVGGEEEKYDKEDEYGRYYCPGMFRKKGDDSLREARPNMYFPLYYTDEGKVYLEPAEGRKEVYPKDSKGVERRWLWGRETTQERSHKLFASRNGTIYVKKYYDKGKRSKVRSIFNSPAYYTEAATKEIKEIYGAKVFETPKPVKLIHDLLDLVDMEDGDIVLDFFAGTGTTAESVSLLNQQDYVKRKTILVETNAQIPRSHIAYKHGYRKISDLTYTRLNYIYKKNQSSFMSVEISKNHA